MKRKLLAVALAAASCAGMTPSAAVGAQSRVGNPRRAEKIAWQAGRQQGAEKVSPDLLDHARGRRPGETVAVVIQLNGPATGQLSGLLRGSGLQVRGHLKQLRTIAADLPPGVLDDVAAFDEVESVTRDYEVFMSGHVINTTGAANVRALPALKGGGSVSVDGSGVGIAVLDSGVDSSHMSLRDAGGGARTVFAKDFTGEGTTADAYGHGTHVSSTAAGNGKLSGHSGSFAGMAPNATLVNLRVLDSRGVGRVSWVLAALDWVLSGGNKYKIRVVNLSLGAPAVDSYKIDPLCKAVRRLSDAGIVVVAAAGNDGKTTTNRFGNHNSKTYGLIHSPGNEPSAITVGAANTFGTDYRGDDAVATYSSRGPTRSFWTDAAGVKHYDNLVKPDLVAPGNRIIYAEAEDNYLVTSFPGLHVDPNEGGGGGDARAMMYMSGTSVSAPVVAGAAALMLQVNPNLTPNLVKAILMYTAQPLAGFNMLEQGAGALNVDGAVRLAQLVRADISARTRAGDALLTADPPAPTTTVAGYPFVWSQGIVVNHAFLTGTALITRYQKVYARGWLLGDGVAEGADALAVNTSMMSSGIVVTDGILTSDGIVVGDGVPWAGDPVFCVNGILVGDGIVVTDGIVLGDGIVVSDGILVGDGIVVGDSAVTSTSVLVAGDDTPHMR